MKQRSKGTAIYLAICIPLFLFVIIGIPLVAAHNAESNGNIRKDPDQNWHAHICVTQQHTIKEHNYTYWCVDKDGQIIDIWW